MVLVRVLVRVFVVVVCIEWVTLSRLARQERRV